VRWTFRRPKLLRPWQPKFKARDLGEYFEGATYLSKCIAEWRKVDATRHLADIVEGKEAPPAT
jgi:hypothetical protein